MNATLEKYLQEYTDFNIGYRTKAAIVIGNLLSRFEPQLTAFHDKFPNKPLDVDMQALEITDATREELTHFLQCFGGQWKKELEDYYPDKIKYVQEVQHPVYEGMKLELRARQVPPPPLCKIVEYEEEVPACKVKRKKIVCPQDDAIEATEVESAN